MSLFFDADWFDARLAERWLDRAALAACAGIDASELERLVKVPVLTLEVARGHSHLDGTVVGRPGSTL